MTEPPVSITHERGRATGGDRAILKPAFVAGTPVHVTGVRAEALPLRPPAAHGRGRKAWPGVGLGTECAWLAGMTEPAVSITRERGRAAWGARAVLKPAFVAGAPVHATGVRAEALPLRPPAAHGRGREAWPAVGLSTECAWPAGMTKPAASVTHEWSRAAWGGRAVLKPAFVAGTPVDATGVSFVSGFRHRAAAVGGEAGSWAVLFRKVLAPAVHHALTDLVQVGVALVSCRRASLSVNVGSAEQEAKGRAQRPGLG
ncbi:MAG: hypothetical protein ABSH34_10025 [Verrucomicrobiota bacterium]